jgi:Flp pilus assembly protein TadD
MTHGRVRAPRRSPKGPSPDSEPATRAARANRAVAVVAVAIAVGSLVLPATASAARGRDEQERRALSLLPADVTPLPAGDPLALTPEVLQWLDLNVPRVLGPEGRLERLLVALQSQPDGSGFHYDPLFAAGAAEVFTARRYNCLGFAHLFIALARQLGIDAYYLEVVRSERYRREGDLLLLTGHVTAAWGEGPGRRIVELDVGARTDYVRAVRIDDRRGAALHYANLGAAALLRGNPQEALPALARAVLTDPGAAEGWVNLGVALRRRGDPAGAEAAYRQAIAAEPRAVAAYDNLYSLLKAQGNTGAAEELLRVVTRRAGGNPWLLLSLGDGALRAGDLGGARRFYRRARHLARDEAAPAAALATWALAAGETGEARRWLRRAESLDPEEPRLALLRLRLTAASG